MNKKLLLCLLILCGMPHCLQAFRFLIKNTNNFSVTAVLTFYYSRNIVIALQTHSPHIQLAPDEEYSLELPARPLTFIPYMREGNRPTNEVLGLVAILGGIGPAEQAVHVFPNDKNCFDFGTWAYTYEERKGGASLDTHTIPRLIP